MKTINQHKETEVKFYLSKPDILIGKLKLLRFSCVQNRLLETNKYFDTKDKKLANKSSVLRLRNDSETHITYKGPGIINQGALTRDEIEFTVNESDSAELFLEALGFEITFIFEKYRQIFIFDDLLITIDETPYGVFCEIEGPNGKQIMEAAIKLDLEWDKRITATYGEIFEILKEKMGLNFRDLTFNNFKSEIKNFYEDIPNIIIAFYINNR